tara:strand:- start:2859 stop:4247 length:1389 start_codon:yes stop_codon:yes gene_type:complete
MNPRPKMTTFGVPFVISLYFDNRVRIDSKPECGSILLNVYDRTTQKRTYVGLGLYCTSDVFEALTGKFTKVKAEEHKGKARVKPLTQQLISKLKGENEILLGKLDGLLKKAQALNSFETCKTLADFKKSIDEKISYTFLDLLKLRTDELQKEKRFGTLNSFKNTKSLLSRYKLDRSRKRGVKIQLISIRAVSFHEINADFLYDLEQYMLVDLKSSRNTVAHHMKNIRTIYNMAVGSNLVKKINYPFGKSTPLMKKYTIRAEQKEKPVLSEEHWDKLMSYESPFPATQKALDMFKLSYCLHGANGYDICTLLKKSVNSKEVQFFRKKTTNSSTLLVKRIVERNEFIDKMFIKYGSDAKSPYVLDLLKPNIDWETAKGRQKCSDINRNWNRAYKRICQTLDIEQISQMWARHQWSTHFRTQGGTLEQLNRLMGHGDMKVTKTYDHSLPHNKEKDLLKDIANKIK